MTTNNAYRAAVAVAVGAALVLVWLMGAVGVIGIEGDRADLMYFGVLAIGVSGAIVARFRPDGMARAMFVTATATASVGVIALMLGKHEAEYSSVSEILGLNAIFVVMFLGSAWLFQKASQEQPPGSSGRWSEAADDDARERRGGPRT